MESFFENKPAIWANYLGSGQYPQGSLECFNESLDRGAHGISLNVQLSKDGHLMAISREELSELCEVSGKVSDYTRDELLSFDAAHTFSSGEGSFPLRGKGYRFLLLEEVLQEFPMANFNVNLFHRDRELSQIYADFLRKGDYSDRVFTGSFHGANLKFFRRELPEAVTSMSFMEFISVYALFRTGLLNLRKKFPAPIYQVPERVGMSELSHGKIVEVLHKAGIKCYVWDVNGEKSLKLAKENGVDACMTRDIELAVKIFKGEGN